MLIHTADPLYETLCGHTERTGEPLRMKLFDAPTSVENLAYQLFTEITEFGFRLTRLEVRETDTSVVIYSREDWVEDSRHPRRRHDASVCSDHLNVSAIREDEIPVLAISSTR